MRPARTPSKVAATTCFPVSDSTGHSVPSVAGTPATAKADANAGRSWDIRPRSKFAVLHADKATNRADRFMSAMSGAVSSPSSDRSVLATGVSTSAGSARP
jgi:hypothetical protein